MNPDDLNTFAQLAIQKQFTPITNLNPVAGGVAGVGSMGLGMGQGGINTGYGGNNNSLSTGLGWNIGTGQLALGGIQALGNLWSAWNAQKMAKEQFNYQKGITETNLTNQIQSYNTTLSDRINARAFTEGRPDGYAEQYLAENQLRDRR